MLPGAGRGGQGGAQVKQGCRQLQCAPAEGIQPPPRGSRRASAAVQAHWRVPDNLMHLYFTSLIVHCCC